MLNARKVFSDHEYILENVRLYYQSTKYIGRGILRWSFKDGLNVDALLKSEGTPNQRRFGGLRIPREKDRTNVRMRVRGGPHWALAPGVYLIDRWDLVNEERLSTTFPRVIFSMRFDGPYSGYSGSALVGPLPNRPVMPDTVAEKRTLEEEDRGPQQWSRTGLDWSSPDIKVKGMQAQENSNYLTITFTLDPDNWDKHSAWKFPEAFKHALAIVLGKDLNLVWRRTGRSTHEYLELRSAREARSLGILAPFRDDFLDKNKLDALTRLFLRESQEAKICQKIFEKLAVAADRSTIRETEFIVSGILEAALRTIQNKPFVYGQHGTWDAESSLTEFRSTYLPNDGWEYWCGQVVDKWKKMRHRAAHPDWIFKEGNPASGEYREEVLQDLMFLSRFYGFLILALSDHRPVKPYFPTTSVR